MNKQKLTLQLSEDPFDTKEVEVELPNGVKLMNTEPFAIERLKDYGIDIENIENTTPKPVISKHRIVEGTIYKINKDYALIDIDSKYTATCKLSKEPKEIVEQLIPNLKLYVKINQDNKGEINASISGALSEVKKKEIYDAIGDSSVGFNAKIVELIHGGYWVEISGIRCFMPGSLAGINKIQNFEELIGKKIVVMPITYDKAKKTIIVSYREYLQTLIPNAIDNLQENIENKITGVVTGATNFGVFAEFDDCLTCLIPKNELNESLNDFNSRNIRPGDKIDFWVKDIISNKKIISTQMGASDDPWITVAKKYKPMTFVNGIIIKKINYGVFVELEKDIVGLLHKSKTGNMEFEIGEEVSVLIRNININEKKITLDIH